MSETFPILDVRPVTASLGAEIGGLRLMDGISDAAGSEIRRALDQYRVIFFREPRSSILPSFTTGCWR